MMGRELDVLEATFFGRCCFGFVEVVADDDFVVEVEFAAPPSDEVAPDFLDLCLVSLSQRSGWSRKN
jgi:hypothetical protein